MEETATPLAFTVPQFCRAHSLSTSGYYELRKEGLTPKEMRLGRTVLISAEAAAAWRRDIESRTMEADAASNAYYSAAA